MIKSIIPLILLTTLFSCGTAQKVSEDIGPEIIKVDVPENLIADFHELFDEYKLIPLETAEASIIGNIDRIVRHNNHYYILDKRNNSVLVFNDNGEFIRKIKKEGRGPGEYQALMDFTIDDKRDQLILHSHRPYKMYFYDMEGNFIREEKMDTYYRDIVYQEDQLILNNGIKENEFTVYLQNLGSKEMNGYLSFGQVNDVKNKPNQISGTRFPSLLKSKSTFLYFPFSSIIYQVQDRKVLPRYQIDFGDLNLPEKYFGNGMLVNEVLNEVNKKGYCIFISNFRESKDYISFSYGAGETVIYAKATKKARVFQSAHLKEEYFFFQGYFGHDGDDENHLIGVMESLDFKNQMDIFKKNPELWEKIPEKHKELDKVLTESSNPTLILARLKDPHKEVNAGL